MEKQNVRMRYLYGTAELKSDCSESANAVIDVKCATDEPSSERSVRKESPALYDSQCKLCRARCFSKQYFKVSQ